MLDRVAALDGTSVALVDGGIGAGNCTGSREKGKGESKGSRSAHIVRREENW